MHCKIQMWIYTVLFRYVDKFHRACLIFSYSSVMLPIYAIVAVANMYY